MGVTTSAPGKLFLFGEYGVLAGGWSVVAAVDRRVVARRRDTPTGYEALGADLDDATALPRAVLAELDEAQAGRGVRACALGELSTDIRQLFTSVSDTPVSNKQVSNQQVSNEPVSEKLGLGSSAASTVALTAACLLTANATLDVDSRRQIFARAFAAHRRLQGGRGSCADVAASVFGGIVGYRLPEPCAPFDGCAGRELALSELASSQLVSEPALVHSCPALPVRVEPIWLGQPAVSTSFVGRCEDALCRDRTSVQNALCRSSELAAMAIEAMQRSDAARLLELVVLADATLEGLGELIEAPIVTDAHRRLREHGLGRGIAVKPSGAGGGDFSLAFGPADAAWESFLDELPVGLRHMPMALGAAGVCLLQ